MKKGTIKKKIVIIVMVAILFTLLYSLNCVLRNGKQTISVKTATNFYGGDTLEAIVTVKENDTGDDLKSKLTVELYDNDDKKVKNTKEKYKINEGEEANISVNLPEDLEGGKYTLKVTSKSGLKKDTVEVPVTIINQKESEVIISLDKGIYKPGDEINYRALFISKNDNTPIDSTSVDISIYDGNDNRVYYETLDTSEYGIVSGTFDIADTVNSGTYKIVASTQTEDVTKEFIVNPYVTPKFEATITTDKDTYLVGEKAIITINANYFFGEPVTNATIQGTINDEEFSGLTNENGTFTKEVEISNNGKYSVNLNIEDSSNYYVEASKVFYATTDVFEIEILPEYSDIISGIDNDIYFITKNADGTPLKTYMSVRVGKVSRDVITDENGIGKVTVTSTDIASFEKGSQSITVTAEDMSGQTVKAVETVSVIKNSGTVLKTDKIKYDENETINVSVNSMIDSTTNQLYIFKGNELIKTISSDESNIEFSLDGVYGLVDICVVSDSGTTNSSYSSTTKVSTNSISTTSNYNHKTIFIKPSKSLNIDIETDKETYEPKDNLNASFNVSNQNGETTDAALLVSILDDAVLSLADNDLSVDNLKIALGDIEITDEGMTAADLYAIVLDDSNETALSSILLKQNLNSISKIETITSSDVETTRYFATFIISVVILLMICLYIFWERNPKLRKNLFDFAIVLIDVIGIFAVVEVYLGKIILDLLKEFDYTKLLSRMDLYSFGRNCNMCCYSYSNIYFYFI